MNQSPRQNLAILREILTKRLNETELRNLCFDLGVDYDILPGAGTADKARELIAYCERRYNIPQLVETVRKQRPDISWSVNVPQVKYKWKVMLAGLAIVIIAIVVTVTLTSTSTPACSYSTKSGQGGTEIITFSQCPAAKVRIEMRKKALVGYGYSLWEVEAYESQSGCESRTSSENLVIGGRADGSSVEHGAVALYKYNNAIDGYMGTRWSSEFSDPQCLEIDLPASKVGKQVSCIVLVWESAFAVEYDVSIISPNSPQPKRMVCGWLLSALRDPVWQGIAGVVAILALIVTLRQIGVPALLWPTPTSTSTPTLTPTAAKATPSNGPTFTPTPCSGDLTPCLPQQGDGCPDNMNPTGEGESVL